MKTRRRKITSETIYNIETDSKESRFSRYATLKLKRHAKTVVNTYGKERVLPSKYVKVTRGKLTGRTKGAFGRSKWENNEEK